MHLKTLRSTQDLSLSKQLLNDPVIQALNQQISAHSSNGPIGTRRQLLATSVKINKNMAPTLHRIANECIEKLSINIPLELYAYSSPSFNAACVKPEEGRLFIMFSSSLLDAFNEQELKFVMGHELGHFMFDHHAIPVGYILSGKTKASPSLALKVSSWSRYAEFSADRAGAHCCDDFNDVGSALFKLASGVTSSVISFNLQSFLQQVEEMQLEDDALSNHSNANDWFLTHPFSPLRVKALQHFYASELANTNNSTKTPLSKSELELAIEGLMQFMSPSYLDMHDDAAKSMRNFLFSASLLVANADGKITQDEISVFEDFFGEDEFSAEFNLEKLEQNLSLRAERVNKSNSPVKRMLLLRDICQIAKANKAVSSEEHAQISKVAELLQVPSVFIDQILNESTELD